ncbi:hypothetical protein BZK37_01720 [Enterococcus casseliflavus]|nr:hypothetical protein BZK37_01720 [Enterococcus casseliflavus]
MNVEDILKETIEVKFGNVKTFAEKINLPYTTVRSILQRGVMNAKVENVIKIADGLNMKAEDLMNLDNNQSISTIYNQLAPPRQEKVYVFVKNQLEEQDKESKQDENITSLEQFRKKKEEKQQLGSIKFCGVVSAGTGEFLVDNQPHENIDLPAEQIPNDADFCLRVNGDSMEPIFHNGDYVFVKRQLEIYSGNIGVVTVNGESFLKRIRFENNNVRLESFNKKYKDIIITENDEFRIVGKVVM